MKLTLTFIILFSGILSVYCQEEITDTSTAEDFITVEVKPEFPGGESDLLKFIAENVTYPQEAKENGIQGKVFVQFIIDKEGYVTKVKTVRGVDPLLDNEAVRVIQSLPRWKPGLQRGKPVKVQFTIPINFKLYKDEKK